MIGLGLGLTMSGSAGSAAAPSDDVPDAFTFTDITDATVSTQYTSNEITVAGIDIASAISITGGTYSVNGGAYTASSGTVSNGDTVTVRVTSSGSASTAVNVVLTIGGVSDTYTVTTAAPAFGVPAPMGTFSNSSSGTTVSGTLTAAASIGTLVMVQAHWVRSSGTISSVTDSKGNTYTPLTQISTGSTQPGRIRLFYSFITVALTTSDTITATMDNSTTNPRHIKIAKVSGALAFDKEAGGSATSTGPHALTPATGTFTNARSIIFGGIKTAGTISSVPGGWTDVMGDAIGAEWALAYRVLTANTAVDPTWTTTNALWIVANAAFTEAT